MMYATMTPMARRIEEQVNAARVEYALPEMERAAADMKRKLENLREQIWDRKTELRDLQQRIADSENVLNIRHRDCEAARFDLVGLTRDLIYHREAYERAVRASGCRSDSEKVKDIIRRVARRHKMPMSHIRSGIRTEPLVRARHQCAWLIARFTRLGLGQISAALGMQNHTSALHGIKRVCQEHGKVCRGWTPERLKDWRA